MKKDGSQNHIEEQFKSRCMAEAYVDHKRKFGWECVVEEFVYE